jgi:photosystem II stability/assembly factor-like uncharacterized protein
VIRDRRFWAVLAAVVALAVIATLALALVFAVRPRSARPPVAAATDLLAVRFADEGTGWVGGTGVIYATADAGASWRVAWTGVENVVSLRSWDSQHVWALISPENDLAPRADHLLRSDDGGSTWASFPLDASLTDLQIAGPMDAWAVIATDPRNPEGVVHTADGGGTWTAVPAMGKPQALCATAEGLLWMANGGSVSLSSDAGRSWSALDSGLPKTGLQAKLGCAGDAVWLLASGGVGASQQAYVVSRSLDRGATWLPVYGEPYFPLAPPGVTEIDAYSGPFAIVTPNAARFVGSCPACPSTQSASLTRTDDAGATSAKTALPATRLESWFDLSFADPEHGWIVASHPSSELLKTTDGGASWERIVLP